VNDAATARPRLDLDPAEQRIECALVDLDHLRVVWRRRDPKGRLIEALVTRSEMQTLRLEPNILYG
jgi:hypothetical protein